MKKLSVLTAAIAAGVFTIAASTAQAGRMEIPSEIGATQSPAAPKKAEKKQQSEKSAKASVAPSKKATKAASKKSRNETKQVASNSASGPRFNTIIQRYAASYGVPVSLAHAVIKVESNYRTNAVGSAGEIGLMQIKPATARMMGYSGSAKGLFNPETNIKYGMKYLAMAHDLGGGTTCGTILKYNAGHAARRMNPVSSAYCSKVKVQMAALGSSI
jgi:soluble lytic murein transglycosylase-like protein